MGSSKGGNNENGAVEDANQTETTNKSGTKGGDAAANDDGQDKPDANGDSNKLEKQ